VSQPLLDRRFLEQLERLTLQWHKSFSGLVGGHNISHFAGPGQEFLDHRTFYPGDDLRSVNWRAYMRFEKLFLKMFQIEPRVPVRILLDVSASMSAGSAAGEPTKFDYLQRLAAALVYIGLVRLDSILLQPFAGRLLDPFLASGGRHRFQPAETWLRTLEGRGETDFFETARQYLTEYPQRGLTVILSDFLGPGDCLRPLQYIADFGHELMLIQLWTREDREPAADGEIELVEAESGSHLRITLDATARRRYTEAFDQHSEELKKLALRNGGRYAGLSIDTPLSDVLFGTLPLANRTRRAQTA
jgi:uncharacterized protein (DUF58 family)